MIKIPFAEYKDFDSCVKANQDKSNPQAYCGSIKSKVEGTKEADLFNKAQPVKVGDKVNKAGKEGQILSVSDAGALVMWKDGRMSREDSSKLNCKSNPFAEYLRMEKRI